jgi:hypothetical protein
VFSLGQLEPSTQIKISISGFDGQHVRVVGQLAVLETGETIDEAHHQIPVKRTY